MAAKGDPSSSSEAQLVQSSVPVSVSPSVPIQTPKISKFGTKPGFVIPKNKLSGSLVPIFKGGVKVEGNNTTNEESTKQTQRKTRWGLDLTQDSAVKKGKALAYQTRLEQINQQLAGVIDKEYDGLESPKEAIKNGPSTESDKDVASKREQLELEKREVIGEILRLNPAFKAPADYKPLQKEGKIPIPINLHLGYNFIGLFSGPASSTQKRLEEETGAKVRLYGITKETKEKHEITQQDNRVSQDTYEELYVNVSADSFEKVDAAIALIELLLKPLSDNNGEITSTNSKSVSGDSATLVNPSYTVMPPIGVNQGTSSVMPPIVTPLPGPMQYQSYAASWYPGTPIANPVAPQSPIQNSFSRFPSSPLAPLGMQPYGGRPPFNPAQTHVQAMQHHGNQHASQPMQSGNVTVPRPAFPMSSQPVSISPYNSIRPSNMPVTPPVGSAGWAPGPQVNPPIQRPNMPYLSGQLMRPPATNMPPPNFGGRPPPVPTSQPLPPNVPSTIAAGLSSANFARPPSLPGQQSDLHTFPSVHAQPSRPFASASPMPLHMLSPTSRPQLPVPTPNPDAPPLLQTPALVHATNSLTASSFTVTTVEKPLPISTSVPVGTPRPIQAPATVSDRPVVTPVITPGSTQSFFPAIQGATAVSSPVPSRAASRPLGPIPGDFTFQPLRGSVPQSPNPAGPSSQTLLQTTVPFHAPPLPSFRSTMQAPAPAANISFARPPIVNVNPSRAPIQPPAPFSVPFSARPSFAEPRSVNLVTQTQIRPPIYSSVSPVLDHRPGSFPVRHDIPVNPHQNQFPPAVRPGNFMIRGPQFGNPSGPVTGKVYPNLGGNQIYDPFSPTSFSPVPKIHGEDPVVGKAPESDAEYEDLMASVGVK